MKRSLLAIAAALALICPALAYKLLQGPTELRCWNQGKACNGYTPFATRGRSFLIDMEGKVIHTWPIGMNPRLLDNGHLTERAVLVYDPAGKRIATITVPTRPTNVCFGGRLSAAELANAPQALKTLDNNGDGNLTRDELRPSDGGQGPEGGRSGQQRPPGQERKR